MNAYCLTNGSSGGSVGLITNALKARDASDEDVILIIQSSVGNAT